MTNSVRGLADGKESALQDRGSDMNAANQEMIDGYNDGRNADSPEPSSNRSESYRHGFLAGRADLLGPQKAHGLSFGEMKRRADAAMLKDPHS